MPLSIKWGKSDVGEGGEIMKILFIVFLGLLLALTSGCTDMMPLTEVPIDPALIGGIEPLEETKCYLSIWEPNPESGGIGALLFFDMAGNTCDDLDIHSEEFRLEQYPVYTYEGVQIVYSVDTDLYCAEPDRNIELISQINESSEDVFRTEFLFVEVEK